MIFLKSEIRAKANTTASLKLFAGKPSPSIGPVLRTQRCQFALNEFYTRTSSSWNPPEAEANSPDT